MDERRIYQYHFQVWPDHGTIRQYYCRTSKKLTCGPAENATAALRSLFFKTFTDKFLFINRLFRKRAFRNRF